MRPNREEVESIIREAAHIMLDAQMDRDAINSKSGHQNFVTIYDKRVQDFLEEQCTKRWPEYLFFAEENDKQAGDPSKQKAFIVDPIDGTSNFIWQLPFSCISFAVVENGEVVMGVVFNPFLDQMYVAQKGQGAYLNGNRLSCPDTQLADGGLFGIGMSPYNSSLQDKTLAIIKKLFPHITDIRRLGSAAMDICMVASGQQIGFYEAELQPWDYSAAMLVARESGAIATNEWFEKPEIAKASSFFVARPKVHQEIRALGIFDC